VLDYDVPDGASSYTMAEQTRDELEEQLDDIVRLGNER